MRTLIKNGKVINVFTDQIEEANVLIEDDCIIGIGDFYKDSDADCVADVSGKYICPGFTDGHIHIESTMLTPAEFDDLIIAITELCGFTAEGELVAEAKN